MKERFNPRIFSIYLILLMIIMISLVNGTYNFISKPYSVKLIILLICITYVYSYVVTNFKYGWLSTILILLLSRYFSIIKTLKSVFAGYKAFIKDIIVNGYITTTYAGYFNNLMYILIPIVTLLIYYIVVIRKK